MTAKAAELTEEAHNMGKLYTNGKLILGTKNEIQRAAFLNSGWHEVTDGSGAAKGRKTSGQRTTKRTG